MKEIKEIQGHKIRFWENYGKKRIYFQGTTKKNGFHYEFDKGWSFKPKCHEMVAFQKAAEAEILEKF